MVRRPLAPTGRGMIVLIGALVAIGPLATDMYLPALPGLGAALNTDAGAAQLTLSAFMVGFAVAQIVAGPLSDRFGRRPVILGGLILFVAASIGCALATSVEALIGLRVLQALGGCVGPVLGRAIVRDIHGGAEAARMLAYVGMVMGLGPAVAPVIGGQLNALFGWQGSFWALALYGALGLIGMWLLVEETNHRRDPTATNPRRLVENYGRLLRHRSYVGYVLTQTFCYAGLFAFLSGGAFVLIDVMGLDPRWFGAAFVFLVVSYLFGAWLSARLSPTWGIDGTLTIGTLACAVGGPAAAGLMIGEVWTIPALIAPLCIYMFGLGVVMPQSTAGALTPFPEIAGTASALLGFIQMTAAALIGGAVGQLYDGTPVPMTVAIAAMGLATLIAFRALIRRQVLATP